MTHRVQADARRAGRPALEPQPRPAVLPVSYAQEQLWFLDRLDKGSPEYNMLQPWHLRGPLHVAALRSALNAIIARHEALRTSFGEDAGEPCQIVHPRVEIDVPLEDLRHLDPAAQHDRVMTAIREERAASFDLARGPVLRARLLKLSEHDHVLLRAVHHIAFDGWSQDVFNRELATFYQAYVQGQPDPLPALRIQYADYALWQRQRLASQLDDDLTYWKQQLAGLPDQLELPTDRPRHAVQSYNGRLHESSVTGPTLDGLRSLALGTHATLNMVLLASAAVLLARHSGQNDFAVGMPTANRTDLELEPLVGFFVNTLAVRVRVQGEMTVRQFVSGVRRTAIEAYQHQEVPFSRVVGELAPRRRLNVPPVVQVLFAMHRPEPEEFRLGDLTVQTIRTEDLPVRCDLELHAYDHTGELRFFWVYNSDLFDTWRIEQMARHYGHLLERFAEHPDRALGDLRVMPDEERSRMLHGWNDPVKSDSTPLTDRITKQVVLTPDAIALSCRGEVWTYAGLERRVTQLAHALVRRGVRPGDFVGIACRREPAMVVAVLAALKVGAGYLPLDLSYPAARLRLILDEVHPRVVLACGDIEALLAATVVLDLDAADVQHELSSMPTHALRGVAAKLHDPAYLLYTSGSTGVPKGVVVDRRALAAFATAAATSLPFAPGDHHVAVASLTFDISIFDVLVPLCHGATVCIATPDETGDVAKLHLLVRDEQANSLQMTPSHLAAFTQLPVENLRGVRVLGGGEPFPAALAATLANAGAEVWNGYGPTEATVYTTFHRVRSEDLINRGATLPIGRRLPNARLYVLDGMLEPVPVGVPGELHVGGISVARGYFGRPDWTSDRFLPDPFGPAASRMYRTGDVVRWRRDSSLEFVGRVDCQTKVRGFRIELGEIEAVLRAHGAVEDAVVLARGEADARHIIAFVLPRDRFVADGLRAHVQHHLPAYMVPSSFTEVDAWPLTPHGKIDRAALSARAVSQPDSDRAPLDQDEAALQAVFIEVLGRPHVGPDDDFFALGGQSLLATRLVNRIRVRLGIDVDVRLVFEAPTVRGLAACLRRELSTHSS